MAPVTFKFDSRVGLVLANIQTVRQVQEITAQDGELSREVDRFLEFLRDDLRRRIPQFRSWKGEVSADLSVDFYPRRQWVVADDAICLAFSMAEVIDGDITGDPCVGLFIPREWKHSQKLYDEVRIVTDEKLAETWQDGDDQWPLLRYLKLEEYCNGKHFDVSRFFEDVTKSIKELLQVYPAVDQAITRLTKK